MRTAPRNDAGRTASRSVHALPTTGDVSFPATETLTGAAAPASHAHTTATSRASARVLMPVPTRGPRRGLQRNLPSCARVDDGRPRHAGAEAPREGVAGRERPDELDADRRGVSERLAVRVERDRGRETVAARQRQLRLEAVLRRRAAIRDRRGRLSAPQPPRGDLR